MPRLARKNIKVFAGSATNNGVFGSLQANNPTITSDVEQIQSLTAWGEGWNAATETSEELPPLEEIQGVEYVTTYQQAYIMQEGVPEWAATVTYYKGSLTKEVTSTGFRIYNSLTDNNTGNLLSDTSNWKKVMDSDDLYATTGELNTAVNTILASLYPVGSLYIGTQSDCPLTTLISGSTWELVAQDRALWGGDGTNANTTIAAGLPNITGTLRANKDWAGASASGAFTYTEESSSIPGGLNSGSLAKYSFNASRSSSIYGNSSTVQPPAYRVNVWRRTA
jgi:hypothetical protein